MCSMVVGRSLIKKFISEKKRKKDIIDFIHICIELYAFRCLSSKKIQVYRDDVFEGQNSHLLIIDFHTYIRFHNIRQSNQFECVGKCLSFFFYSSTQQISDEYTRRLNFQLSKKRTFSINHRKRNYAKGILDEISTFVSCRRCLKEQKNCSVYIYI